MILNCPLPDSLTDIPQPSCPFKFDQMVRLFFQRRQPSDTPTFATLEDLQDVTVWEDLKAAGDDTKITCSPIFAGMTFPQSEALVTGGNDNTTFSGIRDYNGEGSVTVLGTFKNLAPATKRVLDTLAQESLAGTTGISNLTVYFANKNGYIFCNNPLADGVATTTYFGVPVFNFRISSPGSEGLNAPNTNGFSFDMASNWADYLASVLPNFDPLADL